MIARSWAKRPPIICSRFNSSNPRASSSNPPALQAVPAEAALQPSPSGAFRRMRTWRRGPRVQINLQKRYEKFIEIWFLGKCEGVASSNSIVFFGSEDLSAVAPFKHLQTVMETEHRVMARFFQAVELPPRKHRKTGGDSAAVLRSGQCPWCTYRDGWTTSKK